MSISLLRPTKEIPKDAVSGFSIYPTDTNGKCIVSKQKRYIYYPLSAQQGVYEFLRDKFDYAIFDKVKFEAILEKYLIEKHQTTLEKSFYLLPDYHEDDMMLRYKSFAPPMTNMQYYSLVNLLKNSGHDDFLKCEVMMRCCIDDDNYPDLQELPLNDMILHTKEQLNQYKYVMLKATKAHQETDSIKLNFIINNFVENETFIHW